MNTTEHNHDYLTLQKIVEILTDSALNKKEYNFSPDRPQSTFREVADVLTEKGELNKSGDPYDRNALKQLVHRMRLRDKEFKSLEPDWGLFKHHFKYHAVQKRNQTEDKEESISNCIVCGSIMRDTYRKTCSHDCMKFYTQHKDIPHDPNHATSFHEIAYEEQFEN